MHYNIVSYIMENEFFNHIPYIRPQSINIIFMNSYCIPFVRQHKRYIRVKTWVFNTTRVFITFESFFNLTPVFTSGDNHTLQKVFYCCDNKITWVHYFKLEFNLELILCTQKLSWYFIGVYTMINGVIIIAKCYCYNK